MNGIVLKDFIKTARLVNQAVALTGPGIKKEIIIEPDTPYNWEHTNMLLLDDLLIDVTWISCAKVVPNKEERKKQHEDMLKEIQMELNRGLGRGNMVL